MISYLTTGVSFLVLLCLFLLLPIDVLHSLVDLGLVDDVVDSLGGVGRSRVQLVLGSHWLVSDSLHEIVKLRCVFLGDLFDLLLRFFSLTVFAAEKAEQGDLDVGLRLGLQDSTGLGLNRRTVPDVCLKDCLSAGSDSGLGFGFSLGLSLCNDVAMRVGVAVRLELGKHSLIFEINIR